MTIEKSLIETARKLHRLSDIARPFTALKPSSGGLIGLCPFHREKTPSFHVSDDRGTYKCFGCNAWGDVFDFLMTAKGMTFPEAVKELGGDPAGWTDVSPPVLREVERQATEINDQRRIKHAHEIWLKRQMVTGTVASDYLRQTRAIPGALPEILGYVHRAYCSPLKDEVPALIAPLQDRHGHVTAVQQIFLSLETMDAYRDEGGRRIKRTLGAMRDGCVRLGLPDTTLGLAGSVEDALAASALFSLPVWATCGEQRFEKVWIPEEIEHLVIFADADEAGKRAAQAAEHAHGGQIEVTVHAPKKVKDWAAVMEMRVPQ